MVRRTDAVSLSLLVVRFLPVLVVVCSLRGELCFLSRVVSALRGVASSDVEGVGMGRLPGNEMVVNILHPAGDLEP